jgi:alkylhydroperoxidase/carboxymuconolactone decarboxylase family protein YurZ
VDVASGPQDAWIEMPPREVLRELGVPTYHGMIAGMARLIASHPRFALPFGALFGEVMRGPGVLTVAEREMVAAVTAAAQDCFY